MTSLGLIRETKRLPIADVDESMHLAHVIV